MMRKRFAAVRPPKAGSFSGGENASVPRGESASYSLLFINTLGTSLPLQPRFARKNSAWNAGELVEKTKLSVGKLDAPKPQLYGTSWDTEPTMRALPAVAGTDLRRSAPSCLAL